MTATPRDDAPATSGRHDAEGAIAAAFFDIDNTIIRGASAYHLVRELHRRRFFTAADIRFFLRSAMGYFLVGEDAVDIPMVRDRALGVIRGRSVAEMTAIAEAVYDEVLDTKVFPGARDILDRHRAGGHQIWFITAGPQEVADLVAHRLGATGGVGTAAEAKDGYYTGRLVGPTMHGAQKAATAREIAEREGFDLERCYAYGDSVNDIPMLSEVGNPCAINPEPRLRRHCAHVGWPVRDFRRRRSSVKRKVTSTAGTAGVAWGLTVALRSLRPKPGDQADPKR